MKPIGNYVSIKVEPKDKFKATPSGIIYELNIKSDAPVKEATLQGRIIGLGNKVNDGMVNGHRLEEGDLVTFFPDAAVQVLVRGEAINIVHRNGLVTLIR
jgi:co-chaperonin GroES (HSP10)